MKGAREYAKLFKTGQYGRLYLLSGEHARGYTFHIWVLPDDTTIDDFPWKDAVEVYGITGGNPGWTETYGWLHHGKWEQDFTAMVDERRMNIAVETARRDSEKVAAEDSERQRKMSLLATY